MDRARLDVWCDRAIAGLVLVILLFGPLATGAFRPQDFLVIQGLALAAGALWCVRLWLQPEPRLLFPPIGWAVLAFAGYAIARYLTADLEYVARKELIKILVYALVFFLVVNHAHQQKRADFIVLVLIFLAMGIALYALAQYVSHSNRVWHFIRPAVYAGRGSGTYICPNHLAGFLEMLLPLALSYLFLGRLKLPIRIALGYAAVWLVVGLYVSKSRGGWVAASLGVIAVCSVLLRHRRQQIAAFALLVGLILAALLVELRTGQFRQRFAAMDQDNPTNDWATRCMLWKPAWQMWRDHFWVGVGPGHFDYRFRPYRPPRLQVQPDRVHNDYLNALADWGLAGTVPILLAVGLVYWSIFRRWHALVPAADPVAGDPQPRSALVLGGGAGLLAILAHSMVDYNMHVPANAILALLLMAMLTGNLQGSEPQYWCRLGRWGKRALTLGLAVLLLAGGWQGWIGFAEWRWLERADGESQDGRRQIAAWERAFEIEPTNFETAYNLGEAYRLWSWQGAEGYAALAEQAMHWFERSSRLNPFDPYSPMRYGMCLDWLGRHAEAAPFFERAIALDPNGYYVAAHQGWHFFQTGNYAEAKRWFEQSYHLNWWNNSMTTTYFILLDRALREQATATFTNAP